MKETVSTHRCALSKHESRPVLRACVLPPRTRRSPSSTWTLDCALLGARLLRRRWVRGVALGEGVGELLDAAGAGLRTHRGLDAVQEGEAVGAVQRGVDVGEAAHG